MDINTVFVKTTKGQTVLTEHGKELTAQERYVFVLIDGVRTVGNMIDQLTFMNHKDIVDCVYVLLTKELIAQYDKNNSKNQRGNIGIPINQKTKQIIEAEMINYLGPLAALICDEVWAKTNDLRTALFMLKSEFSSVEQGEEFIEKVREKL